jgi:hypothetical protein
VLLEATEETGIAELLEFADEDDQTSHVVLRERWVLFDTTGFEDDHSTHVWGGGELLIDATEETGELVEDALQTLQDEGAESVSLYSACEDRVCDALCFLQEVFTLPTDDVGEEVLCASLPSTRPARIELAKTNKTNELLTMVASGGLVM